MIPPAFVHDLISRVDIVDVIGRHVQLKKGGLNLSGLCPFHAEKSPSFTVSPTKQFYHCFGCGANGDAIRFLTEYSGMSFVDAIKDLAQQVGMTVPEDDVSPQQREAAAAAKQRQSTLIDVQSKAAEHYRKQLKADPRAIDYLKGRGLSGEVAARFGLGYAPEGWKSLASAFADYDDPLLEESGLVILSGGGDDGDTDGGTPRKRYDRFRDRVMFPIRSVQGDVIGFGGRVLDRGEPKYLNSPETPVFSKGRELYGLHEARSALRGAGYALVVEGYMDVVALAQLGFPNAVATLGTACTAEHVQKLFRFTDDVVFSFDGDAAGRRAAGRALEAALPYATDTRSAKFLYLPAEHDPDSYLREFGAEAFGRCIQQAVPLSRELVAMAQQGCDVQTAEGRARFAANARPLWSALPDGALKRQLFNELALLASLTVGDLAALWGVTSRPATVSNSLRTPPMRGRNTRHGATSLLDRALWLLVHRVEIWGDFDAASHDILAEQASPYGELFAVIERSWMEHGPQTPATLLAQLRGDDSASAEPAAADAAQAANQHSHATVDRIAALHPPDPATDLRRELAILIDRLRLRALEDELKLLFESGPLSPDAQRRGVELMRAQSQLKAALVRGAVDAANAG